MRLFLDLLVLENDVLLNGEHLVPETLNRNQLVIWLSLLDLEEYLEDLMVLILHINEAQLLLLVLSDKADQLTTLLDLVERLDELVGEVLDPLDVLVLDLDERLPDTFFPLADYGNVWLVFYDRFRRVCLNLLELLELILVLLVDVVQILRGHDALETLVLLLGLGVEGRGRVMRGTVDS